MRIPPHAPSLVGRMGCCTWIGKRCSSQLPPHPLSSPPSLSLCFPRLAHRRRMRSRSRGPPRPCPASLLFRWFLVFVFSFCFFFPGASARGGAPPVMRVAKRRHKCNYKTEKRKEKKKKTEQRRAEVAPSGRRGESGGALPPSRACVGTLEHLDTHMHTHAHAYGVYDDLYPL